MKGVVLMKKFVLIVLAMSILATACGRSEGACAGQTSGRILEKIEEALPDESVACAVKVEVKPNLLDKIERTIPVSSFLYTRLEVGESYSLYRPCGSELYTMMEES
jgi:hypothetical protein